MKDIFRKLKVLVKAAIGKTILIKPDLDCSKERIGSEYGGWDVNTETIDKHSTVYSFGVGEDASFDIALIEKFGLTVHAFDPTPRSIEWVRRQEFSDRFVMHEYGIASFDGTVSFNPPENPEHVSHTLLNRTSTKSRAISVPVNKLDTIMRQLGHDQIDILKMDIEGAEFDVINDISMSDTRPKQILVEFHHRFPGAGIDRTKQAIDRLKSMGYGLFSISATHEEFCFKLKFS